MYTSHPILNVVLCSLCVGFGFIFDVAAFAFPILSSLCGPLCSAHIIAHRLMLNIAYVRLLLNCSKCAHYRCHSLLPARSLLLLSPLSFARSLFVIDSRFESLKRIFLTKRTQLKALFRIKH